MKKTNRQILVIDDDAVTRKLICHNLEKEGYTVYDANSSNEGLAQIKKHNIDGFVSLKVMNFPTQIKHQLHPNQTQNSF